MTKKTHKLSELFYYDSNKKKNKELKKGLHEYRFLLRVASLAAQNLQNGDLEKFDALVGENACQIRAIKIALIASEDLSYLNKLLQRLSIAMTQVDALLETKSINILMQKGISLKEVIDQHMLDIELTSDEIFFIQAYVLSEMKESLDEDFVVSLCRKRRFIPNQLKILDPQISSEFMGDFANKTRKLLAASSVNFVQQAAFHLQDPLLLDVLLNFTSEHNTKLCAPMFWTYKTLLFLAQKKGIPLIFHTKLLKENNSKFHIIDQELTYFKPCHITKRYIETTPTKDDLNSNACVIQGIVCIKNNEHPPSITTHWRHLLEKHSPVDVILAGAADHRQYPDSNQEIHFQDETYERYKKLAKIHGFSLCNPSSFFIQHVYSAQVGKKYPYSQKSVAL